MEPTPMIVLTVAHLGQIVATPGALDALAAADTTPAALLRRHAAGDWGDLDAHDRAANAAALHDGSRLLSAYTIAEGVTVWIITEAADEHGYRPATTLLLPQEY
jgi:hypothetical protein